MNAGPPVVEVCLATCAGEKESSPVVRAWRESAARDTHGIYRLTDDPARADFILFVDLHMSADWRLRSLQNHELVRRFREKVLAYNERDHPWCVLPGLYCSMPAPHFDGRLQRACAYYGAVDFSADPRATAASEPDLLFSFLGSRSHPIRGRVLQLTHPRAVVEDTSGFIFYDRSDPVAYDQKKERFASTLRRSKFVLCPRGAGTASIRLFETLVAGRVPVIVSDAWVAPSGPDWDAFSLRVPEADIPSIPARLEAAESRFPAMAAAARAAHAEWFARPVIFHRLMEQCHELLTAGATAFRPRRDLRYLELALRQAKHRVRGAVGRLRRLAGAR